MKSATRIIAAVLIFSAESLPLSTRANAQSAPSLYTSATRYDAMGRITGTISPDPDGTGPLKYAAVRNSYDTVGRLVKAEKGELSTWKSETVTPQNWGSAFNVFQTVDTVYDPNTGRKTKESASTGGVVMAVTQFSYDGLGQLQCTAVRMDSSQWANQPDPCTAQTSAQDADRVTKNVYDAAGELVQLRRGVGTPSETAQTYSYTPNGKQEYLIDGNGNRAQFKYDGFDRQQQWIFPSPTPPPAFNDATQATALSTAGQTDAADYEQYGYDANGNRTSLRKRDGRTVTLYYDALNRVSSKIVPDTCVSGYICGSLAALADSAVRDVYYDYDLQGHQLHAKFDSSAGADGITNTYDGFSDVTSSSITMSVSTGTFAETVCSSTQPCSFDADGDRVQMSIDGQAFTYSYDGLDRLGGIYEGTSAVGTASLDQFVYNSDGTTYSRTEGATGTSQSTATYQYDGIGRLHIQTDAFPSFTSSNVSWTLGRNAASQVNSEVRNNDAYKYGTFFSVNATYNTNGLNQYTSASTANLCYDSNGNLTADGSSVYLYDVENRLVQKRVQSSSTCPNGTTGYGGALQANVIYDPLGRLVQVNQGTTATATDFLYDGDALVAEYNYSAGPLSLSARYVHGTNLTADDPLAGYTSGALSSRRFLHADHLGSIVAMTNGASAPSINSYDEYGIPKTDTTGAVLNTGRFQYTGQAYIPELGMYYYKARIYSPRLGRFMQTDPIGYKNETNLYDYVADDPVDGLDPTGTTCIEGPCTVIIAQHELAHPRQAALMSAVAVTPFAVALAPDIGLGLLARAPAITNWANILADVVAPGAGVGTGALFAQRTFRETFEAGGQEFFKDTFGVAVKTVEDLASAIKTGRINSSEVPIGTITRGGQEYILNTRSAAALERAGVSRENWSKIDLTGDKEAESRLTGQLKRNELTPPQGCTTPRNTGCH